MLGLVARMRFQRVLAACLMGGTAASLTWAYTAKGIIEFMERYHAEAFIPFVILLAIGFTLMHLRRNKRKRREELFRDYRVLILGPNSLAAYLLSISMNYRVESFNERASEIMNEFGKLKKEFEKFSNSTNELRKKAEEILNKIDEYGTRERQMSKAIDNMENINKEKR